MVVSCNKVIFFEFLPPIYRNLLSRPVSIRCFIFVKLCLVSAFECEIEINLNLKDCSSGLPRRTWSAWNGTAAFAIFD